jgi:hypothetical protein
MLGTQIQWYLPDHTLQAASTGKSHMAHPTRQGASVVDILFRPGTGVVEGTSECHVLTRKFAYSYG